jgi:hypothetical protein
MDMGNMSALEVLKEIKQIMDQRLGDKLAGTPTEDPKQMMEEALQGEKSPMEMAPDAKGLEVSKVKVMGKDGAEPMTKAEDEIQDQEMKDGIDQEMLKKIRQAMM